MSQLLTNLQDLVLDALEAVEFKLVRTEEDIYDDTKVFHPLMAHQIFGDNENIFGYTDLKINIMYTADSLHTYIGIKYKSKVDERDGLKADDVIGTIAEILPNANGCYFTNMDEFLKILAKSASFKPFGEKLQEYIVTDKMGNNRHFEIYMCDHSSTKFTSYFNRLQTFVLWFVDAASYIDVDDPQWRYFICFEKYKNDVDGNYRYASVGYTTIYEYYAYPEHIRPRISQMLVLTPFQKLGIGTKFIESVYNYFATKNVVDITVEDPSDDFQRLRNYVDCNLCKDLLCFSKDRIKNGFTQDMVKEAREKFKINPKQCRVVYEILRFYHTNVLNENDYKNFRLMIKQRLNAPHQKQKGYLNKMEKAKIDTQAFKATLLSSEEQIEFLTKEYEKVENEYTKIIEKMKG